MKVSDITKCAVGTAVLAGLSQISVPLPSGIPITMQTFGVMLIGIALGKKNGALAATVYVMLAALGLPVLANLSGGIHTILGPTGGFIFTFPLMSYICGYAGEMSNNYRYLFLGTVISVVINYAAGCSYFAFSTGASFAESFMVCVVPFLLTDTVKITLAVFSGQRVRSAVLHMV
jgi:biotin transport system substrate-specific component